jgi:hypothetical protein
MTPVDEFMGSVRDVFARNREVAWTRNGLFVAGAVVVSIALGRWLGYRRKRRATAEAVSTLAATAGLARTDLAFLARIAKTGGQSLPEVMSNLGAFEVATARLLEQKAAPPPRPAAGSVFERVRQLRKALGFSPLPAHHWLLSTRELISGDPVAVGGIAGHVVEVNEAAFAVDLPAETALPIGASAALTIVRIDDSRYLSRVRVLLIERAHTGAGTTTCRAFFSHDEHPDRQQSRAYVRVRVAGPVTIRPVEPPAEPPAAIEDRPPATIVLIGSLVDLSAGGLSLDLPASATGSLAAGSHVRCSFALGEGARFDSIVAVVLALGKVPSSGLLHMRGAFVALPDTERDRLAAVVARHLAKTSAAASDPSHSEPD